MLAESADDGVRQWIEQARPENKNREEEEGEGFERERSEVYVRVGQYSRFMNKSRNNMDSDYRYTILTERTGKSFYLKIIYGYFDRFNIIYVSSHINGNQVQFLIRIEIEIFGHVFAISNDLW